MMNYIRAVIFDLDDTLIELGPNSSYVDTFANLLRQVLKDKTGSNFSTWKKRRLYPAIGLPHEQSQYYMKNVFGLKTDPEEVWTEMEKLDYKKRIGRIGTEIVAFEDARELLKSLKEDQEKYIGVITNTPLSITEMQLQELGLRKNINSIRAFRYNQPKSKPNPWGITDMLNEFGVNPKESWVFGDSGEDTATGLAAGTFTGQLFRKGHIHYDGPEPHVMGENLLDLWQNANEFMRDKYEMQMR